MTGKYGNPSFNRVIVCCGLAVAYVVIVASIMILSPGLRLTFWLIGLYGTVAFLTATFFAIRWYVAGILLFFIALVLFLLIPFTNPSGRLEERRGESFDAQDRIMASDIVRFATRTNL